MCSCIVFSSGLRLLAMIATTLQRAVLLLVSGNVADTLVDEPPISTFAPVSLASFLCVV